MNSVPLQRSLFFVKKMTKRQIVTICILGGLTGLGIVAGLGFATRDTNDPADAELTVLPVQSEEAELVTSFRQRRTFTGVLRAARTSDLGFERTGRLIAVEVDEGDRVEADQVLAKIDSENLEAKQKELTAQRAAAQSLLDELEAGPRKQTIDTARAELRDLESQFELAQLDFRRRERLLKSQATSQRDYERASLGLKSITARLDAAKHQLDELEEGTRPEKIDAQRAVVAQLDAALADIEVDLEESKLRAPFAGMIGKRYLDEGAIVAPGAPLLRLVEDQQLEAWIGLPAGLSSSLEIGQSVTLAIDQQEQTGQVRAVLPELDSATRTRTVIFQLDSGAKAFPDQIVRIEIEDLVEANGFWVPTTALSRGSRGLWSVFVVEKADQAEHSVAARRDVEVLHTDGRRALVRGTLTSGDQVILRGAHRLVAGQPVSTTSKF